MRFKNKTVELPEEVIAEIDRNNEGTKDTRNFNKKVRNAARDRKRARKQSRLEKKQRKNASRQKIQPHQEPAKKNIESQTKKRKHATDERTDQEKMAKLAKTNPRFYNLLSKSNMVDPSFDTIGSGGGASGLRDFEDMEMKRLEKKLGIKKGKGVSKAFKDEGLDYILDGITVGSSSIKDNGKSRAAEIPTGADDSDDDGLLQEYGYDESMESEGEDDSDDVNESEEETNELAEQSNASDDDDDDDEGSDFEISEDSEDSKTLNEPAQVPEPKLKKAEPVQKQETASKYIPPRLRAQMAAAAAANSQEDDTERLMKVRKLVQGQLNRLSESNMESIINEIESIYFRFPRADVNNVLTKIVIQSVRSRIHMLDTFLYMNAAFVSAIYKIIGLEAGANLIQSLMEQFEEMFNVNISQIHSAGGIVDDEFAMNNGKECVNLAAFLSELYNFKVITSQLLYDVMDMCAGELNEFTAELMLKIVQISGVELRKDDPLRLKSIVVGVNKSASESKGKMGNVRCKFMIETLTNLKNNKLKRTMNASADNVTRLSKFIGNLSKKRSVTATEPINIGLQDIRDSKSKGKWWLVGASWAGNGDSKTTGSMSASKSELEKENAATQKLLKLAKKHHMNTDVRKSIFVTIMSSEDYTDAFERLMRLGLKEIQQREIIRVLLHCCGQEKVFNLYYALITHRLCTTDYSFKVTLQYALWDFMRELGETDVGGLGRIGNGMADDDDGFGSSDGQQVPLRKVANLAKFYGWLFSKQSISLTVLKTITFPKLQERARLFLELTFNQFFLTFRNMTKEDIFTLRDILSKAAAIPALGKGIVFFLRHFVRSGSMITDEEEKKVVKWGCRISKEILQNESISSSLL